MGGKPILIFIWYVKCKIDFTKLQKDAIKGQENEKNTYYFSDLINCEIIDQNSNYIGKVITVEDYPAQRTLRIKTEGKDVLIPFVNAFIKNVDIENKKIYVNIIEGMLWKSMF